MIQAGYDAPDPPQLAIGDPLTPSVARLVAAGPDLATALLKDEIVAVVDDAHGVLGRDPTDMAQGHIVVEHIAFARTAAGERVERPPATDRLDEEYPPEPVGELVPVLDDDEVFDLCNAWIPRHAIE